MSLPEITVLMPIWNADPDYLVEAIDSVFAQDFDRWELVIVEDPSDRISKAIINEYEDQRIRYFLQPDRSSLVEQLNRGLAEARANIIARLDADDVCESNRLSSQFEFLERHPEIDLVGCQLTIIDERGERYAERDYPVDSRRVSMGMQFRNAIAHPAATFRKQPVLELGGYDGNFRHVEDYELWLRMIKNGSQLSNLPTRLLRYRHHSEQVKSVSLKNQLRATIRLKQHHLSQQMVLRARMRYWVEWAMLCLPANIIDRIFQWTHLRNDLH